MKAAVVIPALNEERTVADVVTQASEYADPIVVDDGSSDATSASSRKAGAVVLRHASPRGYDAALQTGFLEAARSGYEYIASLDADGELDPRCLADLLRPLVEGGADLSLGNRSRKARWSERLMGRYTDVRFGVPDALCGAKAFRTSLFSEYPSAMLGQSIGTGLALTALRNGYRPAIVSITAGRRFDRSRFGSGLRPNLRIVDLMLRNVVTDLVVLGSRLLGHD